MGRLGGGDVGLADFARKSAPDRLEHAFERDDPDLGGKGAEQRRVGHRTADMFQREFGRRNGRAHGPRAAGWTISSRCISLQAARGVDEQIAVGLQALGHVDRPEQRRVLDDQRVGLWIGSRSRISLSSMRQNATTGAPMRSEPKLGNACACLPSRNAATDSISAAVTTPWPPRP